MARILIADADRALVDGWRRALEDAGHDVAVQTSGADALRYVDQTAPDVVVAEMVMKGGGGLALAARIKLAGSDVKVIVISGHPAILDPAVDGLALARRSGADLTLTKPITPAALVDAVHTMLGSREAAAS